MKQNDLVISTSWYTPYIEAQHDSTSTTHCAFSTTDQSGTKTLWEHFEHHAPHRIAFWSVSSTKINTQGARYYKAHGRFLRKLKDCQCAWQCKNTKIIQLPGCVSFVYPPPKHEETKRLLCITLKTLCVQILFTVALHVSGYCQLRVSQRLACSGRLCVSSPVWSSW